MDAYGWSVIFLRMEYTNAVDGKWPLLLLLVPGRSAKTSAV